MTPEKFEYWRKYGEEVIGFRWGPGVCCLNFAHLGVFLMLPVSLQLWRADALQMSCGKDLPTREREHWQLRVDWDLRA